MYKKITSSGYAGQTVSSTDANAWAGELALLGYQITQQLYAGSRTLVYRGIRECDRKQVILKLLRNEMPTFSELLQFRNQYAIMRGITETNSSNLNLLGIIQPYSLEPFGNGWLLVMEDFGGISLSQFTQGNPLEIAAFLPLAIQLADSLHHLYQHRVIHKDIKPANILIHPETQKVKLIDFSISSLLPRETQEIQNLNVLEGTIAYISPEQTGRMNRGIDYRSDFYSLGVTFYQLLAGKLPFQSDDPMELIHSHLAARPIPLDKANPELPPVLSQIVAKLMAKNAEDRYQSAMGLKHDLETCLHQWNATGTIAHFAIAQQDRCDRFIIPEKLYGRETEVATLLAAFDRVANPPQPGREEIVPTLNKGGLGGVEKEREEVVPPLSKGRLGGVELMLVAGFSGIGKTAVINEVHKPIVRARGYCIKGKYDQFQRNIPFSAFVQAFRDLMAQLLGESKVQLAQWRTKILQAAGENGQVLIDVIPELERIIGKQLPVPELSGSAAQNRFNLVFQKFIQLFTTKEHPLVMFLDDLQWADSASLALLKLLLSETETGYLLVLGAYRDNEVFPAHPLMLTLEEIKKAAATINTITLTPLNPADINQLVADTLFCSKELAQPLTDLTYQKTKGNPFFATQFLKALYGDCAIAFNLQENHWECDITQVKAAALIDNVVEFMAAQLQKLPVETQEMLKLASCIGNSFDLTTLAIVSKKSPVDAAASLWKALQEGLILPISETYKFFQSRDAVSTQEISVPYQFLHDRVQQAAYSLIPEDQKQATHLKIGRLILLNTPQEQWEDKIFSIVTSLNTGAELIDNLDEKIKIAHLNLIAGRKAKNSTAYEAAEKYLKSGIALLSVKKWSDRHELTLSLFEEIAETAYLRGNFKEMENWLEEILANAKTLLDRIQAYEIKIGGLTAQDKAIEALETGINLLKQLGISIASKPTDEDVSASLQQSKILWEGKDPLSLISLPIMSGTTQLAIVKILAALIPPAYFTDANLFCMFVFEAVKLGLQYGHANVLPFPYACYGFLLIEIAGETDLGYRFGKLAIEVADILNEKAARGKAIEVFNGHIQHWKGSLNESLNSLLQGYQNSLDAGDIEYAAYNSLIYCYHSYFAGNELSRVKQQMDRYGEVIKRFNHAKAIYWHNIYHQAAIDLMSPSNTPEYLSGNIYDEFESLPLHLKAKDNGSLGTLYLNKTIICYLLSSPGKAMELSDKVAEYLGGLAGQFGLAVWKLYDSLIRLALYSDLPETQQQEFLEKVSTNQMAIDKWAQNAPMNYQHKADLVKAEQHRVLGRKFEAADLYDRAISLAQENGYIQEEALANELAAKFYLDWGKEKVAAGYMQEAYYCYARWGAKAKVVDLETRYRQLLSPILQRAFLGDISPLTTSVNMLVSLHQTLSSSSTSMSNLLDLGTVLKAAQALYSEIHLDKLLATVMQVIVENSGADKAALFLDRDGELEVVIQYLDNTLHSFSPKPVDECEYFPTALIHYVERTLETLIPDSQTHHSIVSDSYFIQHQPQSLLCTPILNQGKLIGVLYLENSLTKGAFTPERVELLKLLCSQAAISLANARLYQQSQTYAQQLHNKSQQLEQTLKDLQTMQLQLVQNEKMSALGNLVAGIAHEINNPVGFLAGNIQPALDNIKDLFSLIDLYQEKYPQINSEIEDEIETIDLEFLREDLPKLVGSMREGVDRILDISTSLRTFSRADSDTPVAFNLHEGIDSTLLILKHRLKANENRPEIQIIKNYGQIPKVECFAGQLNQVFMNLLANAIDALEESNLERSFPEIQANPNQITIRTMLEGNCVKIAIADNGKGMTAEVKSRIFDHLFTTKGVGKGTGLGLAIARQIVVEKHSSTIEVSSILGEGTEFTISIPR